MTMTLKAIPTLIVATVAVFLLGTGILITAVVGLTTPVASATSISGTLDDWEAAVCAQGSLKKGSEQIFRNSIAGDSCQGKNHSGLILIGQWDSNYVMLNDISMLRGRYYTSAIEGQTITDFVTVSGSGSAALQPLTQFGFDIHPVPAQG